MNTALIYGMTVLCTQIFLSVYVLLLVEFRAPAAKWRRNFLVMVGLLVLGNVLWISLGNAEKYRNYGYWTLLFPYMLLTLWCSRYRDARTLFGVSNASYVGCICGINGSVAGLLLPDLQFLPLTVRILSLIGMFFVMWRFSRTCRVMMRQLEQGWFFLWMIPLVTSLLSMYLHGHFFQKKPLMTSVVIYGMLAVCSTSYYLMYLFFERVQTETEAQANQRLLSVQVSDLKRRIELSRSAEEKLQIQRHDMRHQLSLIRELILGNNHEAVLAFLESSEKRLDDTFITKWCNAPILNAVFTSYFSRAETENIHLDIKLSFPKVLPVDESELAIVFANALENAINANLLFAEEKREIKCRVITEPAMMFEISNPCVTKVQFDESGIPITKKDGHGIGVQSIVSFCKKYHATYQFEQKDDMFILRVIML